jgi:peptidoglycan/LPS O-acetylase OafA/YrhL
MWLAPLVTLPALYAADRSFDSHSRIMGGIGYALIDLSFASLLLSLVGGQGAASSVQRFFTSRIMRAFGKYSYGAYIWHILTRVVVMNLERDVLHRTFPWFVNVPLLVLVTLLVSMASYAVIERPFLTLKQYFKTRGPARVAASGAYV